MAATKLEMYEASVANAAHKVWRDVLESAQGSVEEQKISKIVRKVLIAAMESIHDRFDPSCKQYLRQVWTDALTKAKATFVETETQTVSIVMEKISEQITNQITHFYEPADWEREESVLRSYRCEIYDFALAEAKNTVVTNIAEIPNLLNNILSQAVELYVGKADHYWRDLNFCRCDPPHYNSPLIRKEIELLFDPVGARMYIFSLRSKGVREVVQKALKAKLA